VSAHHGRVGALPFHPEPSRLARVSWRRGAGAALAACLLCASTAQTQDVTELSLKAAFVYNFAKFTEWPSDALPATASFTACVLGDGPISDALERTVKGRLLSGRSINVSRMTLDGPLRTCHLLYVSGVTAAQVSAIVTMVKGAPVLTISDLDDFAPLGGIAHVFVEDGRMRFDLNLDRARLSRLQLSSKLLTLASRVNDGPGTRR
jgi:uncharacterized protein DUF4154